MAGVKSEAEFQETNFTGAFGKEALAQAWGTLRKRKVLVVGSFWFRGVGRPGVASQPRLCFHNGFLLPLLVPILMLRILFLLEVPSFQQAFEVN